MKKLLLGLAVGLVLVFIVIQFIPVELSNPPVTSDISTSPEVKAILKRACYDCHSNETVWPWYSRIAPLSWLVAWDVSKGREELNFSSWERYGVKDQRKKIRESWETVAEGEMPFWYYTMMHREARLSSEARHVLRTWAGESRRTKRSRKDDKNHYERRDDD